MRGAGTRQYRPTLLAEPDTVKTDGLKCGSRGYSTELEASPYVAIL
jgi:hypothetical protein